MLKAFKNKRNLGHHICGLCVKVCGGEIMKALIALEDGDVFEGRAAGSRGSRKVRSCSTRA